MCSARLVAVGEVNKSSGGWVNAGAKRLFVGAASYASALRMKPSHFSGSEKASESPPAGSVEELKPPELTQFGAFSLANGFRE